MRKAQVAGQVFIYILAIVVVGLIIAYGYSAIKGFTKKGEQVEYITLKTSLENAFKGIISDYGSIKRPDIDVPGKYSMVCFVDKSVVEANPANADGYALCTSQPTLERYYSPIACSGWKTGRNNVFLIPDGSEAFDVGNIVIDSLNHFICFDVVNNKIRLQLEGLGNAVKISEYS
jgi:hypothetical protein